MISAAFNKHRYVLLPALLLASLWLAVGCGAEKSELNAEAGFFQDAQGYEPEPSETADSGPPPDKIDDGQAAASEQAPTGGITPSPSGDLQQATESVSQDMEIKSLDLPNDASAGTIEPAPAMKPAATEQQEKEKQETENRETEKQEQGNEAAKEEAAPAGLETPKPASRQVKPAASAKAVAGSGGQPSGGRASSNTLPVIGWDQFFDNEDQTTPSASFWDLSEERQTVNIKGFMGEVLSFDKNWFLLIPEPGAECPFDNGDETYWNKIMIVFVKDGTKLRYTSKPLKLEGRLDVGIKIDESGYKTMFRLYDATFEEIKN
jgi:hypothetical protein